MWPFLQEVVEIVTSGLSDYPVSGQVNFKSFVNINLISAFSAAQSRVSQKPYSRISGPEISCSTCPWCSLAFDSSAQTDDFCPPLPSASRADDSAFGCTQKKLSQEVLNDKCLHHNLLARKGLFSPDTLVFFHTAFVPSLAYAAACIMPCRT